MSFKCQTQKEEEDITMINYALISYYDWNGPLGEQIFVWFAKKKGKCVKPDFANDNITV